MPIYKPTLMSRSYNPCHNSAGKNNPAKNEQGAVDKVVCGPHLRAYDTRTDVIAPTGENGYNGYVTYNLGCAENLSLFRWQAVYCLADKPFVLWSLWKVAFKKSAEILVVIKVFIHNLEEYLSFFFLRG